MSASGDVERQEAGAVAGSAAATAGRAEGEPRVGPELGDRVPGSSRQARREQGQELRCPVCRARPAGRATCRRCGIDLRPWLAAVEWSWRLRESARLALLAGAPSAALRAARMSLALHHTPRGLALLLLAHALRPAH